MTGVIDCRELDVEMLLRQRRPFVLVDRLEESTLTRLCASLLVRGDNLFVDGGHLTSCGLLEHICQASALRMGLDAMLTPGATGRGLIASVRGYTVRALPAVGERVVTGVSIVSAALSFVTLYAEVRMQGRVIAEAYVTAVIDYNSGS